MPELPEVATFEKYLRHTALHKKITEVEVEDERVVLCTADELREGLIGQTFEQTQRIGKHLLISLSSGQYLSMHFGMTGRLRYFKDREDTPRFTKVLFSLEDGYHLGYVCPRILGRLGLTSDVQAYSKKKKLGEDALKISHESFAKKLKKRKGLIKPILMNQSVVAGLGNWIVDDMLYQTGLHPETPMAALEETHIKLLYDKMQYIIRTAIDLETRYDEFPEHFLITHREEGAKSTLYDGDIIRTVVNGRGTYICPVGQKLKV